MTTAQVDERPVTVNNSPTQDYVHPEDHAPLVSINRVPLYDPGNIHYCDIAILKYF